MSDIGIVVIAFFALLAFFFVSQKTHATSKKRHPVVKAKKPHITNISHTSHTIIKPHFKPHFTPQSTSHFTHKKCQKINNHHENDYCNMVFLPSKIDHVNDTDAGIDDLVDDRINHNEVEDGIEDMIDDEVFDDEVFDGEAVNEEAVNEEAVNEEAVNEEAVNEEAVNEEAVDGEEQYGDNHEYSALSRDYSQSFMNSHDGDGNENNNNDNKDKGLPHSSALGMITPEDM
jgi:hypothetical protein